MAPRPAPVFASQHRPRPFNHLWAPQSSLLPATSSSRLFSTALTTSPISTHAAAWASSSSNSTDISSLATAFKRQAYSSSTGAANLDPTTTGAWSNLELDPRGIDHSVFEEASDEYEAALPAPSRKTARSALEIISSLIDTDIAAATQAYEQLREIGTEFDDKAAPIFARAAAQCAAHPDKGQDAVRWLAAIPPRFSFTTLHQVQIADLMKQTSSTLVSLEAAAADTDRASHLAMALHIVVARGLHLFRTGSANALRRTIQRCFMNIVRYASPAKSAGDPSPTSLASVPPSWLEWKQLEDATFEREDDAGLGADQHPALFANRNALSPSLVSAKFRTSLFRNSIRTLATSMRERDALFWALRSSSIDEGASPDTDLDAFTVKVVVEEALKRPRDDLETTRLLDTLLSRLETAMRDAVQDVNKKHFEGLFIAASRAHRATREYLARHKSAGQTISTAILADVQDGNLERAVSKTCDALKAGQISSFPSTSTVSMLLGALDAEGLADSASQIRQLMKSSSSGIRKSVTVAVLEHVSSHRYSDAVAAWRAYFADDGGICDEVCRLALGNVPPNPGRQDDSAAEQIWPRKGDVLVMLRALVGACVQRGASLDDLYHSWLKAAFGNDSTSPPDPKKGWRKGGVELGTRCFNVFLVAFARSSDPGSATSRVTGVMEDMKARGVEPDLISWTKLLETMAKEEVLPEQQTEEPPSSKRSKGKARGRFDGVDIDVEGVPAPAAATGSSPAWASYTMKLARSMGIGAPDGAPEPHMPRASLPTYVSLIGGLLAGPSMKGWRALDLCLEVRSLLEAEARRGVIFTTDDLAREPKAQTVLRRVSWLESRSRSHGQREPGADKRR